MRVRQPSSRQPILGELAAAGVAQPAGLDFLAQRGGCGAAPAVAGLGIERPSDIAPLVEANDEALRRIIGLAERPPALSVPRPTDVPRALPVAGLAADADLRERRGKSIARCIVVLAHAGRMTFGAHEVPVLVQLRPVEDVVVTDLLVRIKMEPALTARFLRSAVPGDRQGLQSAIGELDQILLEWIDAKRVLDLESGELSVGAVRFDLKLSVVTEEARPQLRNSRR